jgi:hypothetical protein
VDRQEIARVLEPNEPLSPTTGHLILEGPHAQYASSYRRDLVSNEVVIKAKE